MKRTILGPSDFLSRGDIAGLLEYRRGLHGDTTMTAPEGAVTVPVPAPAPVAPRQFSQDEVNALLAKAAQEARDSLTPDIAEARRLAEEASAAQKAFQTGLDEQKAAREAAEAEVARLAEEKRLAELDLGGKIEEMQKNSTAQISALQAQFETQAATLQKERQFSELSEYRTQALNENRDKIMPHLVPFVSGNTREEIDASVSAYVQASDGILAEITQARTAQIQGAPGVGVTAPSTGPMDTNSGYQTFSPQDISQMSMSEYAKHRQGLLGAASQTSDRGLLG